MTYNIIDNMPEYNTENDDIIVNKILSNIKSRNLTEEQKKFILTWMEFSASLKKLINLVELN